MHIYPKKKLESYLKCDGMYIEQTYILMSKFFSYIIHFLISDSDGLLSWFDMHFNWLFVIVETLFRLVPKRDFSPCLK